MVFEKIKRKFNISIINKPSIDNQTKNETGLKIVVKNKESNISDEAECHNYPKERVPMAPHIRHAHLHHFGKNGAILKMLDDIHVNKNKSNGIEDMKDYN